MSRTTRSILFWHLAFILTLLIVVYQRMSGPTYPVKGQVEIAGQNISFKLIRTHDSTGDAEIIIQETSPEIEGELQWKRYKSADQWITQKMTRKGEILLGVVPKQPPAGKVTYTVTLLGLDGFKKELTPEPVIIRFKGPVPLYILIPHIFFMFASILLAARTALEAIFGEERVYRFGIYTAVFLVLGGLILGPVVQKFAFGALWTGWPSGHDLTDNKTAFAVFIWIIALWRGRHSKNIRKWIFLAAVLQILIYLIPHSVLGSELDYTKIESGA